MKFFSVLFLLLFVQVFCFAQDKPLPYDENGKLIYYEVVTLNGVSKDSLAMRAGYFFKKNAKKVKLKSAEKDTLLLAEGKMIINKTALVLSRPSGEVHYNFNVETKPGKYRFWLTDFVFIPYQRDRYGNFVPSTTIGTPLESSPGKLNATEWQSYLKNTARESQLLADQFKLVMANKMPVVPTAKAQKVISTKEW